MTLWLKNSDGSAAKVHHFSQTAGSPVRQPPEEDWQGASPWLAWVLSLCGSIGVPGLLMRRVRALKGQANARVFPRPSMASLPCASIDQRGLGELSSREGTQGL